VPAYRIYELKARRRVKRPARVLICENDTDVIRMVEPPADGHDVEIMEGARVVARHAAADDRSWTVSVSGGSLRSAYRAATIWRLLAGRATP
jgi:hypothetical protein